MKKYSDSHFCTNNVEGGINFYKAIAWIGSIVRTAVLPVFVPDFFELLFGNALAYINCPDLLYEILIRLFIGVVEAVGLNKLFHTLAYNTVKLNYRAGSNPVWGSISYTVYYILYSVIAVVLLECVVVPFYSPTIDYNNSVIAATFSSYAGWLIFSMLVTYKLHTYPDFWVAKQTLHCISYLVFYIAIAIIVIGWFW